MTLKDLLKDAHKEGMSVEDIEKALESIDMPNDGSAEIERLRNALSKSNSEAADYKKQLRDKMSAEEQKAKDDADKFNDLQSKYDALLRESDISKNKARATEVAEAMVEGDTDKVFAAQKKHLDSVGKKIREEVLKDTPKPTGGSGSNTVTIENFRKMSPQERYEFSKSHPDEYKELYGGN